MTTSTATSTMPRAGSTTPTDRILTGALIVAPLIYLAADSTYAAAGGTAPPRVSSRFWGPSRTASSC